MLFKIEKTNQTLSSILISKVSLATKIFRRSFSRLKISILILLLLTFIPIEKIEV